MIIVQSATCVHYFVIILVTWASGREAINRRNDRYKNTRKEPVDAGAQILWIRRCNTIVTYEPLKDTDFESVVIPLRVKLLRDTIRYERDEAKGRGGARGLQLDSGIVGDNEPVNFRSSTNTISICF